MLNPVVACWHRCGINLVAEGPLTQPDSSRPLPVLDLCRSGGGLVWRRHMGQFGISVNNSPSDTRWREAFSAVIASLCSRSAHLLDFCLKTIFNQLLAFSRQTLFSRSGFRTSKNGAATDFISN